MASTPRPPRRPVVGSRNPTARPRKVAGRAPGTEHLGDEPVVEQPVVGEPVADEPPVDEPADDDAGSESVAGRLLASRRTTIALVVALVVLAGGVAAEGWYLWLRDDPVVSVQRPVVTGEIAHRAAVEAASQSTTEILSYGYQDFDEQIDEATSKMTDSFAQQFRQTADDVRDDFIARRTEQEFKVVAASVVQASSEQVRALLFLDQYVARAGEGTAVTPYRALVTVVHTDSGWLVSDIETQ